MTAIHDSLTAEGFALVHQGGHHDVYCDGIRHAWTDGGYSGFAPQSKEIAPRAKCDCLDFAKAGASWQQG